MNANNDSHEDTINDGTRHDASRPLVVQKYGGSSLATVEKMRKVAERVVQSAREGHRVVVVVSAMGSTTSDLITLANEVTNEPPVRELDMLLSSGERVSMALLAMAIQEHGLESVSLTGPQAGVRTTDTYTGASIVAVRPERVLSELDEGRVVIVAGYQGSTPDGEVATLGRGGSDTSAVALAAALKADLCEINSDVPGVFTADPRDVDQACKLSKVNAELMRAYAASGAGVLHAPCLALAAEHGVRIVSRATFGKEPGTEIDVRHKLAYAEPCGNDPTVVGIASRKECILVSPEQADFDLAALEAEFGDVHTCVEEVNEETGDTAWLVETEDVANPQEFAKSLARALGERASVTYGLAAVSVVSVAEATKKLAPEIDEVLAGEGITRVAHAATDTVSTRIIPGDRRRDAVSALHDALVHADAMTSAS